jgi:glycosyltransferase involved in cell wall biosynthesis
MRAEALIAGAAEPLPLDDPRETVRVVIASLALGGAERIVVEWLGAEAAAGRACELAVLHARRLALVPPAGVLLLARGTESPLQFMAGLAARWLKAGAPVSTHLIGDELLAALWQAGVRTVPVVHNAPQGWRNDPRGWLPRHVPQVVACADAVQAELRARGCPVPVLALRHRPAIAPAACDAEQRDRVRAEAGIGADTFVVLAVGALKAQKDYPRAIDVLARLAGLRDAVLVIAGGALDAAGLGELDAVIDRAVGAGVEGRLRLPGFVDPIAPWFAAADALLNVSRYEGLSMAVREALAAGLPVLATEVGGQRESSDPGLTLVSRDAPAEVFAQALAVLPVRTELTPRRSARLPRAWSLTLSAHRPGPCDTDTLFVTANLNAGGAQRSLVNLAVPLARRHRLAIGVIGRSTQQTFARILTTSGVRAFRCAASDEPLAAAEALLAWAARHGVHTLCFWNADARVKLLVARFAPAGLRLIDVSPGRYAFEELEAALPWAAAFDMNAADYYARLDDLVLKYRATDLPQGVRTHTIPNGVAARPARAGLPALPRFLVSGRIAPSKKLEVIIAAFCSVAVACRDAELHVVGSAEPRHFEYAHSLVVQAKGARVVFRGAAPALDFLSEPFTAAVVLGTHQGSPNAVLEAMAAGIPVIANASGGTSEMVRDGHTGWLLPEACAAGEVAGAMQAAISDAGRNQEFSRAGRAFVMAHHAIDNMLAGYLALLDESPSMDCAGELAA